MVRKKKTKTKNKTENWQKPQMLCYHVFHLKNNEVLNKTGMIF